MDDTVKERLIAAAEEMIRSGARIEDIKIRDIAAKAGVSAGLVNYHFGSKTELLGLAADRLWADFEPRWESVGRSGSLEELAQLLKDIGEAVETMGRGAELQVRHELLEGKFETAKLLLPVLRSILPPDSTELERKLSAYFLIAPLQLAFLRRDLLADWFGLELTEKEDRDKLFDFVITRILGSPRANAEGRPERI